MKAIEIRKNSLFMKWLDLFTNPSADKFEKVIDSNQPCEDNQYLYWHWEYKPDSCEIISRAIKSFFITVIFLLAAALTLYAFGSTIGELIGFAAMYFTSGIVYFSEWIKAFLTVAVAAGVIGSFFGLLVHWEDIIDAITPKSDASKPSPITSLWKSFKDKYCVPVKITE